MSLTLKQELYLQELLKGKSQREAYRTAFPKSLEWKDESVDNKACALLRNAKVKARYDELINVITESTVWDIRESEKVLREFLKMCVDTKDKKHALGYIKELNQLTRLYDNKDTGKAFNIHIVGTREVEDESC